MSTSSAHAALPDYLIESLDTITAPDSAAAPGVTTPPGMDALDRLAHWWQSVAGDADVVPASPEPSLTSGDPLADGLAAARTAATGGATLLIPRSAGTSTRADIPVRALIAVLAKRDASRVCGQPEGMSDSRWMEECGQVRDMSLALSQHLGDPMSLLRAAGSARLAFTTGMVIGAASARIPMLLNGPQPLAAAVLADRVTIKAKSWCAIASTEQDPASRIAADRLMLDPLLDLTLGHDPDRGPDAAVALLREAIAQRVLG